MKKVKKIVKWLVTPAWERNKAVSLNFYYMCMGDDDNWSELWSYQIEDLLARKIKGVMHIKFVLHRPGLLIGTAGSNIDQIKESLETRLGCPVVITIEESTLWNFTKYNK